MGDNSPIFYFMGILMKDLLTEKYRPDSIKNYVFTDEYMKEKILEWIDNPTNKMIPFPNVLFCGSPGTGKAQGLDNKILTPDGWKRMGDMAVGDKVITFKGTISSVTGVYPQGKKDLYTVTFEDGRSTQCCDDHLWKVNINNDWTVQPLKDFMFKIDDGITIPLVDSSVHKFCKEEDAISKFRSLGNIPVQKGDKIVMGNDPGLKIASVEFYKNDDAQCIMIDDEDHLYVTDDYIVTHNTTLSKILCNECGVEKADILYINASRENNVDTVRNKIHDFCSTMPYGDFKVAILDECLSENEYVKLADGNYIKLKDMDFDKEYNVKSFNMETCEIENDTAHVISKKEDDIYEVELEDGRKIQTTLDHPFLINDNGKIIEKKLQDIKEGDMIVSEKI